MEAPETKVAIIGMAGRFPGAQTLPSFWENVLREGREAISHFEGEPPSNVSSNGDAEWVNAYGHLEHSAWFDNDFFDVSPAEARRMDPQHRLFLECTWEALEDAATDITAFDGFASVYASSSENAYAEYAEEELGRADPLQKYAVSLGNSRDFLATRVGYKLDLRGECLTVQSACSSSLGAVHLACQSLLTGQSELAIAGGVSVGASMTADTRTGYWAEEGFITSPDGHCRPFTEAAQGTVPGEGVGVVILKPLLDALDNQDRIYGVISGSALNNDGDRKVGYQAPSLDGQVGVIRDAMAFADVAPHEIGYLECHGTGTDIGDAIELRALRKIFETDRARLMGPLYLGSVKANVGHLDAAAGVAGLIKATLALHHAERPPLVHADTHAPHAQLEESDVLAVNAEPEPWKAPAGPPRRAGITSLGIGGTNAHALVEEAPTQHRSQSSSATDAPSLLVWSARTDAALDALTGRLTDTFTDRQEELDLDRVARTLQSGRAAFDRRRYLVEETLPDAAEALQGRRFEEAPAAFQDSPRRTAFLFPGSGAYQADMADELLDTYPELRASVEACAERLPARADVNLVDLLTGRDTNSVPDDLGLEHRQSAIVSFEYALGRRLMDWGCTPDALIGSSLGEYTAACLSGALSLDDMLTLVWLRGELLNEVAGGGMTLVDTALSTLTSHVSVTDHLHEAIRVADDSVVVSGPEDVLTTLQAELEDREVRASRLPPRVAYHSPAVDPLREEMTRAFDAVDFAEPEIPYVSNRTGDWIAPDQLRSPESWFEQMRRPVHLREGFQTLYDDGVRLFLEVGPGHGLTKFVDLNFPDHEDVIAKPCLAHPRSDRTDPAALSEAVGTAWLSGATIDWDAVGPSAPVVRLPSYPFERRFFHVRDDPPADGGPDGPAGKPSGDGRPPRSHDNITEPRTSLEETVADVWSEVLELESVGVDEDFFEVGGDSFLALQLRQELSNTFDLALPEESFWEEGTIAGMARRIEQELGTPTASTRDLLVQMNDGADDESPVLLLHPVGGDIFCYRPLVDALPAECPVYGLRAPGLVHPGDEPDTIEHMAEEIVSTVTGQLAASELRLAGWSFGGLLAYEGAARLTEAGISISRLLMIDTEHPSFLRLEVSEDRFLGFEGFVRDLMGVTDAPVDDLDALDKNLDGADETDRLRWLSETMSEWRGTEGAWSADLLRDVYAVYRTNAAAYLEYQPESHAVGRAMTLAVAEDEASPRKAPPDLGWGDLFPHLERLPLQTDHYGIIQPPSTKALAEVLAS